MTAQSFPQMALVCLETADLVNASEVISGKDTIVGRCRCNVLLADFFAINICSPLQVQIFGPPDVKGVPKP